MKLRPLGAAWIVEIRWRTSLVVPLHNFIIPTQHRQKAAYLASSERLGSLYLRFPRAARSRATRSLPSSPESLMKRSA
jgi:hypothetical protein